MTIQSQQARVEALGPAEKIIQLILEHTDHIYHGRPGMVLADGRTLVGVKWVPVTHKEECGEKIVYRMDKVGGKTKRVRVGVLGADGKIRDGSSEVGEYRKPGIFPEVAVYVYKKISEVWKMDNEFAARWASYAFAEDHRDLKVMLSAFMLVQSRKGEPVREHGSTGDILFYDEDFRDVGEAMCLIRKKDSELSPKQLLRLFDVLRLPAVMQLNRELGFSQSSRRPSMNRLEKAIKKWLSFRERNVQLLDGLVRAGYKNTVMALARNVGFKPESPEFFRKLRWEQKQAKDGRRSVGIGEKKEAAETWEGLSEQEICEKIEQGRMSWKRVVGLLPASVGLTRAIVAACIFAGGVSNSDLIILTPTLEELGLLDVPTVKEKWKQAVDGAENQRASNIALRVKKQETVDALQEASDKATQRAVEEVMKDMRVYVMVDKSSSMTSAITRAKSYLSQFVQGFPLDKLHVSVFNTYAKVLTIKHASKAGVEQAFRGEEASGGTTHAAGIRALAAHPPQPNEDTILFVVGDQEEAGDFAEEVRRSGLRFSAIGFLGVSDRYEPWNASMRCVQDTALRLGIPCFRIEADTFNDPYSIPRTMRNLIAATPVASGVVEGRTHQRQSLVDKILKTDLLRKPTWAAV